jgi:cell division protein ZapA
MSQVTVTIAGRSYRMACGEGEEAHLQRLAALFDGKIEELRRSLGELGDLRLHVMAALTFADELTDARQTISALRAEMAALRSREDVPASGQEDLEREDLESRLAEALHRTSERIERLARSLNSPVPHET